MSDVVQLARYRLQKAACKEAVRSMRDRAMPMDQVWRIVRQRLEATEPTN